MKEIFNELFTEYSDPDEYHLWNVKRAAGKVRRVTIQLSLIIIISQEWKNHLKEIVYEIL